MRPTTATLAKAAILAIPLIVASHDLASQPTPPEPATPPEQVLPEPGGTLSDQLGRTGGVIPAPPVGDQEMQVEPPATGSDMPVIPPPGTPENQPNVQPE